MDALLLGLVVVVSCVAGWAIRVLAGDRPMLGDVLRFRWPGWPRGVQEDDDLHWRWRPSAVPPGPPTERLRPRVGLGKRLEDAGRLRR